VRAGTVVRAGSGPVVVVYEHALLGEGVAQLLRSATGAEVLAVPACDPQELTRILAAEPVVVLVECATLRTALDLPAAPPQAVVIELLGRPGAPHTLAAKPFDAARLIRVGQGRDRRTAPAGALGHDRDLYRKSTPRRMGSRRAQRAG
jgi:hypothetical protein